MSLPAFVPLLLLGLLSAPAPAGAETASAVPNPPLVAGAPARRDLSPGESLRFRVELEAGEFARVEVEQIGIDVGVALLAPDGRKLIEADSPTGRFDTEELFWVAESPGGYDLVVSSLEEGAPPGACEVRLLERRPAFPADRVRVRAQAAFAEGYALSQKEATAAQRQAVEALERSLALWREAGERRWEAMTQVAIASSCHNYLDDPARAVSLYEAALPTWRAANDLRMEAFTLFGLATAEWRRNAFPRALERYGAALDLARRLADPSLEAQILSNIAMVRNAAGEKEAALDLYRQALPLLRRTENRYAEQYTLANIGLLYDESGEKQKALDALRESLALCRNLDLRKAEAVVLADIGRIYVEMGEGKTGREHLERSLEISRALGDRPGEALALMSLGQSQADESRPAEALASYGRSLALFREAGDRRFQGVLLNRLAELESLRGDAARALRLAEESLALSRSTGNRFTEGKALTSLAVASAALGDEGAARARLLEARSLQRSTGDRPQLARTCYELARLERRRGDLESALASARTATAIVESLRTEVISHDLRATFFASVRRYHALVIDLLVALNGKAPGSGYDAMALEASERARARALLDLLAESRGEIRQGVAPELLREEKELRTRIGVLVDAEVRRLAGGRRGAGSPREADLESLRAEYQRLQERIRQASPRYAALMQPRPASLETIRRQLGDDTVLLEYWLGEERGYCWTVTPDSLVVRGLPGREEVERRARRLYELLTARNLHPRGEGVPDRQARVARADAALPGAASALRRILLPPAEALGSRRLLVVAAGPLQVVPFPLLPARA
ncbi:MAG TPA: tetratricopeptide repeat protein, partial [Thermoanaerobaculia bacterium]|nr:tetratricopeptide repeat protein [Thermoanaerobaculia bacterium]